MRNKFLGIVFLCVIMLVPLITIVDRSFINKDKETGNTAEISPIAAVGEFLDDIPFRKSLAKFNTKLTRKITNAMYINSTQVILGKNDWLYLRETQPDGSRHPFDAFIVSKTPAARWGDPEDLMGPVVFLASDASNFVNGHVLYVDGGILAYIGKQPK